MYTADMVSTISVDQMIDHRHRTVSEAEIAFKLVCGVLKVRLSCLELTALVALAFGENL